MKLPVKDGYYSSAIYDLLVGVATTSTESYFLVEV